MMERFSRKQRREEKLREKVREMNKVHKDSKLSSSYDETMSALKLIFKDDDTMKFREFESTDGSERKFCVLYCNGMVDTNVINEHIIKPILLTKELPEKEGVIDSLMHMIIQASEVAAVSSYLEIVNAVTYGDTLLFTEDTQEAILIDTKSFQLRSIAEPENEKTMGGPREGFTEGIMTNLSLIRRKLRTNQLKMKFMQLGSETNTQICVAYLDNVVNKEILEDLYRRLSKIHIDGILDVQYINELIRDNAWTPFRTIGDTERPDVVVARMLEGRIALFVDGTPVVLTLPYLFIENFQSCEDYYLNFYYTSFSRGLRILGFFMAIIVPGFYVAMVAFHHEMLPTSLLISIAVERSNAPLPAALEAFIMLTLFDILRETGVRMPINVGQAMSIVGALVIGQAAVQAKLVAAPMIIVVAITGITSLLVPKMEGPLIFMRFFMLGLASALGFLGITVGGAIILTHILGLKSFGVLQLTPDRDLRYQQIKDNFIRAPWWQMITRPAVLTRNRIRQKDSGAED